MHSEMGAQLVTLNRGHSSVSGVRFLVFAPNASAVSVVGHFQCLGWTTSPNATS